MSPDCGPDYVRYRFAVAADDIDPLDPALVQRKPAVAGPGAELLELGAERNLRRG